MEYSSNETCWEHAHFGWEDYAVLGAMFVVSAAIGVFYGFFGPKQKTSQDFLLGGSSMGTFPMSVSLCASFITAIELLGNPAEMYNHGTQFWMTSLTFFFAVPITSYFYLPVYKDLHLTSAYEYLNLRFNTSARTVASAMYVLQMVLYTSVAVYAPALALSHVTGLNTYIAVTLVYIVCIFYSSSGGMKAVMMTDIFQAAVLVGSILLILVLGNSFVGGFDIVWKRSADTGRIEFFNLDPSPFVRHTFWSVVIGGTVYWVTMFSVNQASIQKYMSVETIGQARRALWFSCFGLVFIYTINFYTGMVVFAQYYHCDPLKSKMISASDQLLPLYVMDIMRHMKGLSGFFVAGIFSASLGTVAAALNSLAAVTAKDFIHGVCNLEVNENRGATEGKWLSVTFGLLSFLLVFVIEQLGSILEVALSFNGMVGGITLGMFTLGMFFPWANSKGVIIGALTSFILMMWIGTGTQVAMAEGKITQETKPTFVDDCQCNFTFESTSSPTLELDNTNLLEVNSLYRISYLWYSLIGSSVTVILGMVISILTGPDIPSTLDPLLISPPLRFLFSKFPISWKRKLKLPLEFISEREPLLGNNGSEKWS